MRRILITGGAGFIGNNVARFFSAKGDKVTLFDNFSRRGTKWLYQELKKDFQQIDLIRANIRDQQAVETAVKKQDVVIHLAGQVAVTTSVANPREDFEINAGGTLSVLENIRKTNPQAILLYSSTNKVYGDLSGLRIKETPTRYELVDYPKGISETQPLDFHSPYGCSKGAADQYVRDYSRIYNLQTAVFRQSCIYGPWQLGVEDQGWVAWLVIAAITNKPITIYGNGKQTRDLLYIDDLCRLYDLAIEKITTTKGQIYNIGGGPENAISVWQEFRPILEKLTGKKIKAKFTKERPGDQKIFIADNSKAKKDLGWEPQRSIKDGIGQLNNWVWKYLQSGGKRII